MKREDVKVGMKVITGKLGSAKGILVKDHHLAARKLGLEGTIKGFVPGHGGDVWWVEHKDSVGAYSFKEFRPLISPRKKRKAS